MLTQEELKEILHYDPDTGIFVWIKYRQGVKKNRKAGSENKGYVIICISHKKYCAHRLAWLYMTGSWPKNQIDHKNMNKNCNIWTNLRQATSSQNSMNRGKQINCTSGFKGVHRDKLNKKWRAKIYINNKQIHLGNFNTKEAAHEAYKKAAKKLYGEFLHSSIKD